MKIKKYAIIVELFFALLLSSCQKAEDIYSEVGKGCKFTVSAIEETKAIRQNDSEGSIYWSGKENFWLSTNQTQNPVQVTVDVPEPVATISFVADLPSVPSEQHPVWVTSAASSNLKDGVLNVSIKGAKEVADNFPAVAFSTSRNLQFRNICGGVSFTVANTGISSVDFSGNGGEPLAGNVKVKLNEKGNPVCEVVNDSDLCSSVSLNAPDAEKGFEVGKKYYIDLLPCALSKGFTMTFHKKDGTFAEYKTDKPNTVSRSKYGTLADLDKDLAFGNGEEDTFSITPDKFDVEAAGGEVTFTVTSSIGYEVTNNNPDWISEVSVKDGEKANSKVYTYSVAKNGQAKARTGIIVVCNDNEVCIPVTIKQAAAEEDVFSITPDKFDVEATGGDVTFTVTSSIGYKVTNNNPDWISEVSVKDGENANSKVYTYSVAKNEQTKARTGIIVVCNDNEVCIPVTIKQAAAEEQGGGLKVSKTDFYVNAAGEDIDFTVQSEADYNVKSKVDWVTLKSSDKATGHYCFTVAENAGDDSRTGEITITDSNQDKCTLTVHQDGKHGQQDKSWYDKEFAHKSLAMRFTATWCGYCPRLAESFKEAQGKLPGEIEVLNLHGDGSNLEFDQNGQLENQYQVTGFPSGIIDGRRFVDNGTKDVSNVVVSYAKETVEKYKTVSGISFESSISGQQLTVNVKAYLKKADDYKITAIVTESGMVGYQADYDEGDHWDYHHNDVARIALSNVLGDSFSTTEDAVVKEFTYRVTIPQDYVKENLKIVVYIQRSFGSSSRIQDNRSYGNYYMDNCVSGKAGESIPLAFKSDGSGGTEGIGDGGEIKW